MSRKQLEEYMSKSLSLSKELVKRSKQIKKDQFENFKPLIDDVRKDSLLALYKTQLMLIRRITLLYMAMFVLGQQWLQVLTFMSLNLLSIVYILSVRPFKSKLDNFMNIFNECVNLACSYWITQINDLRYDPNSAYEIGAKIQYTLYFRKIYFYFQYTLYFSWSVNFMILFFLALKEMFAAIRDFYKKRLRKCFACLCRPKEAKETVHVTVAQKITIEKKLIAAKSSGGAALEPIQEHENDDEQLSVESISDKILPAEDNIKTPTTVTTGMMVQKQRSCVQQRDKQTLLPYSSRVIKSGVVDYSHKNSRKILKNQSTSDCFMDYAAGSSLVLDDISPEQILSTLQQTLAAAQKQMDGDDSSEKQPNSTTALVNVSSSQLLPSSRNHNHFEATRVQSPINLHTQNIPITIIGGKLVTTKQTTIQQQEEAKSDEHKEDELSELQMPPSDNE